MNEPAERRQLSVWGMFFLTVLFFVALVGGIAVMASGVWDRPAGKLLVVAVGGGLASALAAVGRLLGWSMVRRDQPATDPVRDARPAPADDTGRNGYDGDDRPGPPRVPPRLWNPNAAALWSLLLSPVFGAYLVAANWRALGRPDRAAASMAWFWGVTGFVAISLAYLFMPDIPAVDAVLRPASLALLILWYTADAQPQAKHVKESFGSAYARRGWAAPLLVGTAAVAVYGVAVFAAAGAFRTPDAAEVAAEVRPLIEEEYRKDPATRTATVQNVSLVHKGNKVYSGHADLSVDGEVARMSVEVIVGFRSLTWQASPVDDE